MSKAFVAAALIVGSIALPATAQEHESGSEAGHGESHEHHPNIFGIFVGATYEGQRENSLAVGLEYERRIGESFGVGGVAEYSFGDLNFWVYGIQLAYHTGRWKWFAMPGYEDGDHERERMVRLGAEYLWKAGEWEVSPQFNIDIVDGHETFVLGVVFGKGF